MISSMGVVNWSSVPSARRPQKDDVAGALHKRKIRQLPQESFGEVRLKGKIKGLQSLDRRQACCRHAPFRCALIAPLNLSSNRAVEKQLVGPLFLPCCLKERGQGLLQLG